MNNIKNFLNKVEVDEFNRVNAVLAVNKRGGITSHDLVDEVRKKLNTRKVGHAGALDPFATGVMLILVGKFTKLSEKLISSEKEYKARILFGVSTKTQDPEGEIKEEKSVELTKKKVLEVLKLFEGGYEQYVPVFSSVKVDGKKLRKMARKAKSFHIQEKDGLRKVTFEMPDSELVIDLPKKQVNMKNIELVDFGEVKLSDYEFTKDLKDKYMYCDISVTVSKGTYIRQFAEDLGEKLHVPAMLLELERTRVGDISLEDCVSLDELSLDKPHDE